MVGWHHYAVSITDTAWTYNMALVALPSIAFDLPEARDERIAVLEAKVARLESVLARLNVALPEPPPAPDVKTVKLRVIEPGPAPREATDSLNITAAFAMLDEKVAAAAAHEASIGVRQHFAGPVEIDASLIDQAFARPAPERLDVVSHVEEFHPKIAERIASTWRTAELLDYLKKLIVDDRGNRAGFAPGVMSELLLLSAVLEAPEDTDRWNANARAI